MVTLRLVAMVDGKEEEVLRYWYHVPRKDDIVFLDGWGVRQVSHVMWTDDLVEIVLK